LLIGTGCAASTACSAALKHALSLTPSPAATSADSSSF
jgi:hypothetical protein